MIDDHDSYGAHMEDEARKGLKKQRFPHEAEWNEYKRKNPLCPRSRPQSLLEDRRPCDKDSGTVDYLPVYVIAAQMRPLIPLAYWNTFINWINCNPKHKAQFISHETDRVKLIIDFHRAYQLPLP